MVQVGERSPRSREVVGRCSVVSIDAGNGYFKMVTAAGRHVSFIAAVKKLKRYEIDDVKVDQRSVLVTLDGDIYAFGELAQNLGGKSLFEAGKIEHTPLAVAAALALSGVAKGAVKVRLLVPDTSKLEWKEAAESLPQSVSTFHAQIFGSSWEQYEPQVSVELVAEGFPVWQWANESGNIPAELRDRPLTGVIDAGTGDLTCSIWTKSGTIVRSAGSSGQVSFSTGAMKELAGSIAAGFSHLCQHTPDRSRILDIIREQGTVPADERVYRYEERGKVHDFTGIFDEVIKDWNRDLIKQLMTDNWGQIWGQLGMVFIVGGACDLLTPMEKATGGRFRVVRLANVEPQMVNAALMAQLG